MENLQGLTELGVLGVCAIWAIKLFFDWLGKKNGIYGNNIEATIGTSVSRITRSENDIIEMKTNHLKHQERIELQMEQNQKDHQEIFVILARIEGKIK